MLGAYHNSSLRDSKVTQESVGESEKALEVVGREKEKEDIVDQLIYFSSSRSYVNVPVITIVGLAGIGKTTLAQLVCEDEKVKQQVGLPVRVKQAKQKVCEDEKCNTFDADSIAKQAIGSVETAAATSPTTENLDIILILDDWRLEIEDKHLKQLQYKLKENWRVEIESKDLKALQNKLEEQRRVEIEGMDQKALKDKLKEYRRLEIEEGMDEKALKDKLKEEYCGLEIEGMDLKALQDKLIKEAHPCVTAIMITTRSYLVAMFKKIIGT